VSAGGVSAQQLAEIEPAEELERLAMFAISAKNDLERLLGRPGERPAP